MMIEPAVLLGGLNLVGQLALGYLVLWVKNELLKMESKIMREVEEKYQTKAMCQANERLRTWRHGEERT